MTRTNMKCYRQGRRWYAGVLLFICVLSLIALSGCGGSRLLTGPPAVAHRTEGNQENEVLLYESHYLITSSGATSVRTHSIMQVGSAGTEHALAVFDGSMMHLTGYEARIVHADGSSDRYDINDLGSSTLSSARVIAERSLRHVGLKRIPGPGDLVEYVSEHQVGLPQLGIQFSPAESGDRSLLATCLIEVPRGDTVFTLLQNDTLGTAAVITRNASTTVYRFDWHHFRHMPRRHRFDRLNHDAVLLALSPALGPKTWKEFGDWYLGEIAGKLRADDQIAAAAKGAVREGMNEREKMFAIAGYCQSNIRYEQVYLEGGEFIPNDAGLIFQHRYGDCKDYSTLMVAMARAVGLNPDLVLCRRGNGVAFFDALPVSQFNHMIVHLQLEEQEYWFDGTNPPEAIGLADDDLMNGTALILAQGASRLDTIHESPVNLFSLQGALNVNGDDLLGNLSIGLRGQYAVGFLEARRWENSATMTSSLICWFQQSVASSVTVSDLRWRVDSTAFHVDVICRFPNALLRVGGGEYVRFDRIFNKLLPQDEPGSEPGQAFYYPGYARVSVEVTMPEYQSPTGEGEFRWRDRFVLPAGPFTDASRGDFLDRYRSECEKASRNVRLTRRGTP